MSAKISNNRKTFVKQAEKAVGRSLSPAERKHALGLDETVIGLALESKGEHEISRMLSDTGRDSDWVALFERLAAGADAVVAGRQRLVRFLKPKESDILSAFDFDADLERLSGWFLALLRSEPIPSTIRALNFGLFESGGGCKLYVTGANTYDAGDSEWACANDWWPEGRYAPLEGLRKMYRRLGRAKVEPWVVAQALAILLVRALFEKHSSELKALLGRKRLFIASGFDDGDLYAISTPVTRTA